MAGKERRSPTKNPLDRTSGEQTNRRQPVSTPKGGPKGRTRNKPPVTVVEGSPSLLDSKLFWWVATVILVVCAIASMPSPSGLVFLCAAVLSCPARRVQELGPLARLRSLLPFPRAIPTLVALLAILGSLFLPSRGGFSPLSGLQLRQAHASVLGPVEYSQNPIDVFDYIICDDEDVNLSVLSDVLASKVGTQQVSVRLSKGIFRKTEDVDITVVDTCPPVVKLSATKAFADLGEDFDPHEVIDQIADPVDGELMEVSEVPQAMGTVVGTERWYTQGWYLISDTYDLDTPGVYEVTIDACDQHGNTAQNSFRLAVTDPLEGVTLTKTSDTLEYAKEPIDPTELVSCSDPDTSVTAKQMPLDEVGTNTVTYTLSKGHSTRNVSIDFLVRDTKAPSIRLASDSVTVGLGEALDPYGNVSSVTDPVDGALKRVESQPDDDGDGWYTITGSYDTGVAGTYQLTVVACDRNGNSAFRQFVVIVEGSDG